MSVLKSLQEQQPTSETSSPSMSRLDAIEQQLTKLTRTVADQTGYVKVMDEQQEKRLERLTRLISQLRELFSTLQPDDETKKRLTELEKTVRAMALQLSRSEVVRLPDGSSVTRSDLEAHEMMTGLREQMKAVASGNEALAAEVHAKTRVEVDSAEVAQVVTSKLGATIDAKVAESADRVESILKAHEARLEALGRSQEAEVSSRLREATEGLKRAEKVASGLKGALTWAGVGKVATASIPLALVALAIAMLLGLGGQLLGVGPVFAWAWAGFAAAEAWWVKLIIAVSTVSGASALGWVVYRLGRRLSDVYRGW